VPVWHSRYLVDKISRIGGNVEYYLMGSETNRRYEEVPNAGHWYDGIMTQGLIGEFLTTISSNPPFTAPTTRSFLIANPREMGQRGGIKVDQLVSWKTYLLRNTEV